MICPITNFCSLIEKNVSLKHFCLLMSGIALFALLAAFTAQYGFDLRPCKLCLIQRIPFSIVILLGLIGYFVANLRSKIVVATGVIFWINSAIAFFHSGVERKWWVWESGCTTPDLNGSMEEIIARIKATSVVRCDEIPWSFMGLSMANYNVIFCFFLGLVCFAYLLLRQCKTPPTC